MSDVAGPAKRIQDKYLRKMYHIGNEDDLIKQRHRKSFCPNCKSYIPIGSKCPKCGFVPPADDSQERSTRRDV